MPNDNPLLRDEPAGRGKLISSAASIGESSQE